MHPGWVRNARDLCKAAGIPFFFKGWGEWIPWSCISKVLKEEIWDIPDKFKHDVIKYPDGHTEGIYRVRKSHAGCLLDGKEYKEVP